jgi:hypothetical protein
MAPNRLCTRSSAIVAFIATALIAAAPLPGHAQGVGSWSAADAPRFLRVSADSSQPPAVIDPSDVPLLRHRISLHLSAMSRRAALKEIGRASGIQFVYADDAVAARDSVRLQADDITVTAALTEVLLGAGVDVALGADGNAILMRRAAVAQQAPPPKRDVIRGRVTTAESSHAIPDAEVIATMAPDRIVFRTSTDSTGRYELVITPATGDYLVYISAPGRVTFRKRVTSGSRDTVFVVDAALAKAVQTLQAVRTVARRIPPTREDHLGEGVGTSMGEGVSVAGALSPDQAGDLNALAALVPGVVTNPDGTISFGGMDASQNRTTLNGMQFDGGKLPRGMQTRSRAATSVFDPTVGGFGGGYIATDIMEGGFLTTAYSYISLDAPQLQGGDASSGQLGHQFTGLTASYARSGELSQDLWVYNAAVQANRRTSDAPSMLGVDAATLARLGVSADSAALFLRALGTAGIPARIAAIPGSTTTNALDVAFRVDRVPATGLFFGSRDTRPRLGIVGSAIISATDPTGASAFTPPSHDAHSMSGNFALQLNASRYFGADAAYLDEFRSAFSLGLSSTNPYLDLPSGSVLTTSALPDGTEGLARLQFGGATPASSRHTWRWETTNTLSFDLPKSPTHHIKLFAQAQVDGYSQSSSGNLLGAYAFNSLSDLISNVPAEFTRTLFAPDRSGGELSGAFALADYWTPTPDLRFVFGPRVDATAFTRVPVYNADLAQTFGVRNDVVPSSIDVSPRIGFTWVAGGSRKSVSGSMMTPIGQNIVPPKGILRGGIGEFRSTLAPSLTSDALVTTGNPGSAIRQIDCIGPAVPTPNWTQFLSGPATIPAACAAGAASSFTEAAPPVRLFDRSYNAPRRWTGDLSWTSANNYFVYTIRGQYHIALDQPGVTDLNFAGPPQFSLADEANRPVFVAPASIVPSTGLIGLTGARPSSEFGQVLSSRSNLQRTLRQFTLSLQPTMFSGANQRGVRRWLAGVSYTHTDGRALAGGFDGSTFGDPRALEWGPLATPEHQVQAQLGYYLAKPKLAITAFVGLQSGASYTPLVGSDINGDGSANDRAFVFDPAHSPSASVASGMSSLLATAPTEARDCVLHQLGTVAGRNSCRLPWSIATNMRIEWNQRIGNDEDWAHVSLNFANPAAGLDQLLHGSGSLHGWGVPALPDPTLLYVTGFDPASRTFVYQVNQRFGNTRPNALQLYNPFRVTLDVSIRIAPGVVKQSARYYTRPTRSSPGVPPPADTILARIKNDRVTSPSPYGWILANADSLLLSAAQVRTLSDASELLRERADSLQRSYAAELAAMAGKGDAQAIMDRVHAAQGNRPDSYKDYQLIGRVLTPIQRRLLPTFFANEVDAAMKRP